MTLDLSKFPRTPPEAPLYLYLADESYTIPWVTGGQIPLYPARKYLAEDDAGIYTRDEIVQARYSGISAKGLSRVVDLRGGTFIMKNCVVEDYQGNTHYAIANVSVQHDDAYLLCLSTEKSKRLLKQFDKQVAVEILYFDLIVGAVEAASGSTTFYGKVAYTFGDDRSHFLKGMQAIWQHEYRLVLRQSGSDPLWVNLPPNVARKIEL